MTAKKSTVETTTYTTFTVPLAELLDAYIPPEERHKPLCTWWVTSHGEATADFVRMERTAVAHDDEGRSRLEEERKAHDES